MSMKFKLAASALAMMALTAAPHTIAQDANFDELGPEMETAGRPDTNDAAEAAPTEPMLDAGDDSFAEELPDIVYDEAPPVDEPETAEDETADPDSEADADADTLADEDEPPTE